MRLSAARPLGAVLTVLALVGACGALAGPAAGPAAGSPGASAQLPALLAQRSRALLTRDRAAFLGGVDAGSPQFVARQAALFHALAGVPLAAWSYTVDTARRPAGARWSPPVSLSYALAGVDPSPARSGQHLTFVRRAGRWLLAADDSPAELWDGGAVTAVRGAHSLVLGHADPDGQLRRLAADVDAAAGRVTAALGPGWSRQVVVLLPADRAEFDRLVRGAGDGRLVAVAQQAGPAGQGLTGQGLTGQGLTGPGPDPAERVVVDPSALATLSPLGRRVVLTHEVVHVAMRGATGPRTPAWLSEGLAEQVAWSGEQVPTGTAAAELAQDVRAGRLPVSLPADGAFTAGAPGLAQAYEQAWLAVRMLVRQDGMPRVLAFYRAVGAATSGPPDAALAAALSQVLGLSAAQLTSRWRDDLRGQLS